MGKIGKRTPICLACGKRIRDEHPYVGVEELESGQEMRYHARAECQMGAGEQLAALIKGGHVYVAHHYHVCGDENPTFGCSGGCFSGVPVFGSN
jgi:hypothetical protein